MFKALKSVNLCSTKLNHYSDNLYLYFNRNYVL